MHLNTAFQRFSNMFQTVFKRIRNGFQTCLKWLWKNVWKYFKKIFELLFSVNIFWSSFEMRSFIHSFMFKTHFETFVTVWLPSGYSMNLSTLMKRNKDRTRVFDRNFLARQLTLCTPSVCRLLQTPSLDSYPDEHKLQSDWRQYSIWLPSFPSPSLLFFCAFFTPSRPLRA